MCLSFAQVEHHMRRLEDYLIDDRNLELKARLELPFSMMISGSEYVIRSTDKLELMAEKYRFDPDRDVLDLDVVRMARERILFNTIHFRIASKIYFY
jgi:hypothetical protein